MEEEALRDREESAEREQKFVDFWECVIDYLDWEREYLGGTWDEAKVLAISISGLLAYVIQDLAKGTDKDQILIKLRLMWREA